MRAGQAAVLVASGNSRQMAGLAFRIMASAGAAALALSLGGTAIAQATVKAVQAPVPMNAPAPVGSATPATPATTAPTVAAPAVPAEREPLKEPVMHWSLANAKQLLAVIGNIAEEGLLPADYKPAELRAAIAAGEGDALDTLASQLMGWLIEDRRDGRTPMKARVQWFAFDKDMDVNPTEAVMARALESKDIAGTLASLDPTYPDYQILRDALATAPDAKTKALIRANMDRWRWLSRDLGEYYLMTNVPEYQLRLVRNDKIVRTFRTIVGKPGKTATPQLSELVEGVIFNPTWTVPQSIVKGEGLGAQLLANPAKAKAQGYAVTKAKDGTITVVQQPGPTNSLGYMKLDMPNPHAIFLHDTPNRNLFNLESRALSHGCVRTERAKVVAIALAIIGGGKTAEEAEAISNSGKYTRVPMTRTMPVYIGYFTMARSIDGDLRAFNDIYGRDAPLLASFAKPRELKTGQRISDEKVIAIDKPGV